MQKGTEVRQERSRQQRPWRLTTKRWKISERMYAGQLKSQHVAL